MTLFRYGLGASIVIAFAAYQWIKTNRPDWLHFDYFGSTHGPTGVPTSSTSRRTSGDDSDDELELLRARARKRRGSGEVAKKSGGEDVAGVEGDSKGKASSDSSFMVREGGGSGEVGGASGVEPGVQEGLRHRVVYREGELNMEESGMPNTAGEEVRKSIVLDKQVTLEVGEIHGQERGEIAIPLVVRVEVSEDDQRLGNTSFETLEESVKPESMERQEASTSRLNGQDQEEANAVTLSSLAESPTTSLKPTVSESTTENAHTKPQEVPTEEVNEAALEKEIEQRREALHSLMAEVGWEEEQLVSMRAMISSREDISEISQTDPKPELDPAATIAHESTDASIPGSAPAAENLTFALDSTSNEGPNTITLPFHWNLSSSFSTESAVSTPRAEVPPPIIPIEQFSSNDSEDDHEGRDNDARDDDDEEHTSGFNVSQSSLDPSANGAQDQEAQDQGTNPSESHQRARSPSTSSASASASDFDFDVQSISESMIEMISAEGTSTRASSVVNEGDEQENACDHEEDEENDLHQRQKESLINPDHQESATKSSSRYSNAESKGDGDEEDARSLTDSWSEIGSMKSSSERAPSPVEGF
ncbi:hypothetical protein HK102_000501 [Quaeritorhiza haematococci]|nr:hypothetical protein HK102_000501 [Quaeritorhiza haematococci]